MCTFLLTSVILGFCSAPFVEDRPTYIWPLNEEKRFWKLEHEVETQRREAASVEAFRKLFYEEQIATLRREVLAMEAIVNDNRMLLRDGTASRSSVLERLVHLEEQQRKSEQWQNEQKLADSQNRQLFWALGISIVGHFLSVAWAVARRWAHKQNTVSGAAEPAD